MLGDAAAAEDCVQEAFERAFRAWPRFRPERPAEAWVHQIALNVAISYKRRARLREVGELLRRLGRPSERQAPPDRELLRALSALPVAQSAAFVLRHYHGYNNREVARLLDVSERTVGSRLAAARTALIQALGPDWGLPTRGRSSVAMESRDV